MIEAETDFHFSLILCNFTPINRNLTMKLSTEQKKIANLLDSIDRKIRIWNCYPNKKRLNFT